MNTNKTEIEQVREALEAIQNMQDFTLDNILAAEEALQEKLERLENGGWLPIESAPQGVWILINAHGVVMQACWNSNGWWDTFNGNRVVQTTHWQPLPPAPKQGDK